MGLLHLLQRGEFPVREGHRLAKCGPASEDNGVIYGCRWGWGGGGADMRCACVCVRVLGMDVFVCVHVHVRVCARV